MEMGSGSRGGSASSDPIKGLTFGEKLYFEDGGGGGSSSGQSEKPPGGKKGKGLAQGAQQLPRCQVEGCKTDLSGAKAYYLRHKVCGMHSKSPKVIVAGLEQRFCQQCSRFHLLPEFDQGKRSCRRRLAGHNERRRKPHPVPPLSRYGRLPSFQEESGRRRSFLMDFTYPRPPGREVWPTLRASSNWQAGFSPPPSRVPEHGAHQYMQGPIGGNLFPNPGTPPVECLAGVSDSSCALSLLSTQQWCASTRSQAPAAPASISFESAPMAQTVVSDNYAAGSYNFRCHGTSSSSNELQHEMTLGQIQHTGDAQFSSELELALQGNRLQLYPGSGREYDQSDHGHGHGMHWSL